MKGLVEVQGMIIKSMPVGDYDKRITILTMERGKLFSFVRGARRQGNPFMGISRVFAFGWFTLYEGRDSYNLHSARITHYFQDIHEDLLKTCYGSYFLELADYYGREHLREPMMTKLLFVSLLALSKPSIPQRLTRRIYELRLMVINGEYSELPGESDDGDLLYTWHYICTSPIEKLYTFTLQEKVLKALETEVDRLIQHYIEKPMHSLEILNAIAT